MKCRAAAGATAALAVLVGSRVVAFAATPSPNDYFFVQHDQWALTGAAGSIDAPGAWPVATGYGVTVADVDTGVNFAHPDLQGKLVAGARFTSCSNANANNPAGAVPDATGQDAVQDDVGHGSMTTGIIAAATNNGQGIASVAPDARVLVVKVLSRTIQSNPITGQRSPTGSGCSGDVAAGIYWSVYHGAKVVNLSIGSEIPLTGSVGSIINAIKYAYQHDVAVAVAAGNNQLPVSDYQSISSDALVVGANGPNGQTAWYSTSGLGVNLYAPGGDDRQSNDIHGLVVSTNWPDPQYVDSPYAIGEGTSFAAPHAAGVLALLRSCGMSGAQARSQVLGVASARNQNLDAGATLAGMGNCAHPPATSTSGTSRPAPQQGGGSSSSSGNSGGSPAGADRTAGSTAAGTPAPTGTARGEPGAAETPGAGDVHGSGAIVPRGSGSSGGGLNPAVVAGLGLLVVGGAPIAVAFGRRLRR